MRHLPANFGHGQGAARARCFHPTGVFTEFAKEEIERSIVDRFEAQVREHPRRVAVQTRNRGITYDELNVQANRIAYATLRERGEGQEPTALLLEQGTQAIACILGALKAGKAYVPLDPTYPAARVAYILQDSRTGLLLTNSRNLGFARDVAGDRLQIVNIDRLPKGTSTADLGRSISPDSLAYIMYTSGSTGQPKGVMQTHRNLLHDIMVVTNEIHMCPDDRQTLLRSCSFNGSVRDIFGALLNGASLHLWNTAEEGVVGLARWLTKHEITVYRSVVSVFRHFASQLTGEESFPSLRVIHVGGEPVYRKDVELCRRHFAASCIFVNGLGITEAGSVRHNFIDQRTPLQDDVVPVGYEVGGKEVLITGDDSEELGHGEVGEVIVKSPLLSPGYWRKPDLTKARFLEDRRGGVVRRYRTGDLGRTMPDGCLVLLGRKDFQIKIRGQRVEIAEIETALLGLSSVHEAVVIAREDSKGSRLVAYITSSTKPAPATAAGLHGAL